MVGISGLLHIIHASILRCCEFLLLEEARDDGVLPLEIDIADVEIGVMTSFPFVNFPGIVEPIEPLFVALGTLGVSSVGLGRLRRLLGGFNVRGSDCVGAGGFWYRLSVAYGY